MTSLRGTLAPLCMSCRSPDIESSTETASTPSCARPNGPKKKTTINDTVPHQAFTMGGLPPGQGENKRGCAMGLRTVYRISCDSQ